MTAAPTNPRAARERYLALAVAVLAVGIPYWLIPYNTVNLPDALLAPGLLVVCVAAGVLRARKAATVWKATWFVGGAVPAAVMLRVLVDCLQDPTRHNLWPFELIIAVMVGAATAFPGALFGMLLAKRHGDDDA